MACTITTIIALALLFFAGKLALNEHRWLRQARTTQGTVVSLRRKIGSKGRGSYYPRVSFIGSDGRTHECEGSLGSNPPDFKTGDRVLVAYRPDTFEGRILTFAQRFAFPAVLATLGFVLMTAVLVFQVGNYYVPRIYLTDGQG